MEQIAENIEIAGKTSQFKPFLQLGARLLNHANILFGVALLLLAMPGKRPVTDVDAWHLVGFLLFVIFLYGVSCLLWASNDSKRRSTTDITAIVFAVVILWELTTTKLDLFERLIFPVPGKVIAVFIGEIPMFMKCLGSSLQLLGAGYGLALVTAIPLALVIGWRKRLFAVVNPMTKVLGPIPPIVYIPYSIAIFPTFKCSSIFIIFIGAFWPVFINTLNGTFNIEPKIIDSARVLNVKEKTLLFRIILPAILPAILSGATLGLVFSFILLTAAEMIGSSSGLGWYVKYFSDFADYPRVVAGIFFIGLVVTAITFFFELIEKKLLRWRS
ncbi:ABC transporter permease [Desulfuromonas thiophila]|uniref:NitT/TauT family transport system permease protein n=1 Tax=Desulfuromonas thiophila TaxID=57664 RepID=A0A1G6WUW0_9BACT|nr:ABC transporter permease [Desulfuromonas thiophila]SDD69682.1 NitT/TauT family transport system permease protein [Desulfuromonas thiophila]